MKGHKWFASIYDGMLATQEKRYLAALRAELLSDVSGEVLEIGAGTGANFRHYPKSARVTATEPDPYMLQKARPRAEEAQATVTLQQTSAEDMPFADASFDFVVVTLVLCSVKDQQGVLSEIRRMLKPGGELRLYEHVRYKNPVGALAQDIVSPVWQWFGAGCHPNRDTGKALRASGFDVIQEEIRKDASPVPPMIFSRPHLRAIARRP